MSSLSLKSGNTIQDRKEILNETMQFYKELYSKWEVKKVDLNALLAFLAHLSRRLRGELIVYQSSRRPSVRPSVRPCVRASVHTFKHEYL